MNGRTSPTRFRWRSMLVPAGGLLITAGVGWMTLGDVLASIAPERAQTIGRGSSSALANEALALLAVQPTGKNQVMAASLSTQALLKEPSNPRAALALAAVKSAEGNATAANSLLRYSESLSRRELLTQMGLIENEVAAGNVVGALQHYDRALTTSKQAPALLMPVLVGAAAEPAIAAALATMLARRPLWWRSFIEELSRHGTAPAQMRRIAAGLHLAPDNQVERQLLNGLLTRMIGIGGYDDAATLYAVVVHPPGPVAGTGSRAFDNARPVFPFDWQIIDGAEVGAYLETRPRGRMALILRAGDGANGTVARRLVLLPPGHYTVTVRYGSVSDNPLTRPVVSFRCATDQNPFQVLPLPMAAEAGRVVRFAAGIGPRCPAQWLEIGATGSAGQSTVGWIDQIRLD